MTLPSYAGNKPLLQDIYNAATVNGISPYTLAAIVQQESGGDPTIVENVSNPVIGSNVGYGLTQLTSAGLLKQAGAGLFDPVTNLNVGAQYLAQTIANAGGNLWQGIASYNGSGNAAAAYADTITNLANSFQASGLFSGFSYGPNQPLQGPLQPPHFPGNQASNSGLSVFQILPPGTWTGAVPPTTNDTATPVGLSSLPVIGGAGNVLGSFGNDIGSIFSNLGGGASNVVNGATQLPGTVAQDVLQGTGSLLGNLWLTVSRWLLMAGLAIAAFVILDELLTEGQGRTAAYNNLGEMAAE